MLRTATALAALSLASVVCHAGPPQPLTLSVVNNADNGLPGLSPFTDNDAVSTLLDGAAASVQFSLLGGDIDALHRTGPDTWLVSSLFNGNFNGTIFDDGDIVEINTTTGSVTVVFSQDLFTTSGEDITGVSMLPNGNLLISTLAEATLGGITFGDGDVVEYNLTTGVATLFLAEATIFDDGNADIYGIHYFDDGKLLLTANTDEVVSGTLFRDGDAFLYDPADDSATLVFSEDTFTTSAALDDDIDALYFEGDLPGGGNDCIGDFDNDGDVDLTDFGTFGAAFGSMTGDANYNADADFDDDGDVDLTDFGSFGAEFGRTDCLD